MVIQSASKRLWISAVLFIICIWYSLNLSSIFFFYRSVSQPQAIQFKQTNNNSNRLRRQYQFTSNIHSKHGNHQNQYVLFNSFHLNTFTNWTMNSSHHFPANQYHSICTMVIFIIKILWRDCHRQFKLSSSVSPKMSGGMHSNEWLCSFRMVSSNLVRVFFNI